MMKLLVIGDLQCDKEQIKTYCNAEGGYSFLTAFSEVRKVFTKYDIIIGNLETPVSKDKEKYVEKEYSFCAPEEFLHAIKKVGIGIVTTANNHCLDRGVEGLFETNRLLDANAILNLGTRTEKGKRYKIIEADGIKVGLLSFTYGTNAFINQEYLEEGNEYMVDLLQRQELSNKCIRKLWFSQGILPKFLRKIMKALHICQFHKPVHEREERNSIEEKIFTDSIKECKAEEPDIVLALLHIGGQYNYAPTDYTLRICELTRAEGVDIILANHEHVVHPIKRRELSPNNLVAYSLGNFMSSSGVLRAPYDKMADYSIGIDIDLHNNNGKTHVVCSFIIFKSIYTEQELRTVSLANYILEFHADEKLLNDYQIIANRVLGTKDIVYEVQEKLPLWEWEK